MGNEKTIIETTSDITLGLPHNVVLFNDESHAMDEVINQIVKAIHCDPTRAFQIMMEAHTKGRAIVFSGSLERCELVESILCEIRLSTKIE
jgi:ATP-dependent Clp protease adapter protein ClpS